jgi:RNA polymerase sigma factor (TIGR02999 family)
MASELQGRKGFVSDTIRLMGCYRQGDANAAAELVKLFYPELRRLACARMKGERQGHSWQPTLLVNELYLELVRIKALQPVSPDNQEEKAAFFGLAAQIMRRLLIHHARPLCQRAGKVELRDDAPDLTPGARTLSELEDTLARLARVNRQLRTVVEMKVFHGLTIEEIAARIGCAPITAKRYWTFAKQWLADELTESRHK